MRHATLSRQPARPARARGFTLIELLTVVSILAILMAAVGPSLAGFAAGQKVKGTAYDLTAALLYARSEALKRNGSVRISRVGESWNNGWTVKVVASDTTLNTQGAMSSALSFTHAPESIVFNAYGRVSSPVEAVKFDLSSSAAPESKRCIALSLSGHASSSVGTCS